MRRLFISFFLLIFSLNSTSAVLAMSSTNYNVSWDSVNSGGLDVGTSTNYLLRDTLGEQATGYSSSSHYTMSAGYRTGDQDIPQLSFDIGTQENWTRVTYVEFNLAEKYVNVSDSDGFNPSDFIGVVENEGLDQFIAVGKVTRVIGTKVYVDKWSGIAALLSQSPAGGDDFVYRMNGKAANFGSLMSGTVRTSLTVTDVVSNAKNGYTVLVSDDGDLRAGPASIHNVADGEVSVGTEEYGWRVFGEKAVNGDSDKPFQMDPTPLQQSSDVAYDSERVGLVYKLSIVPYTPDGDYSHQVYYTVTANY